MSSEKFMPNSFTWDSRCYDTKYDFDVLSVWIWVANTPPDNGMVIIDKLRELNLILDVINFEEEYDPFYDEEYYFGHITATIEIRETDKDVVFKFLIDECDFVEY